jgi:pyruvate/2-oxoglutarate dehydrogenase complex dihydrolipoamide acyltransferase (E2) component
MIEETTPQAGDTQLPGSGDVDAPATPTDATPTTTPAGTTAFGVVPADEPEDDDIWVVVPRASGQYGVPQVNGHQIIYDVLDGLVRVRPDHLQRFLFVVEGSRVYDEPIASPNLPVDGEEPPSAPLRQAMPLEAPAAAAEPPAATPAAVKAATDAGVDLVDVAQSQGVDKVTKADVAAHLEAQAAAPVDGGANGPLPPPVEPAPADNQVEDSAPAAEPASAPAEPPAAVESAGPAPAEVPTDDSTQGPVAEASSTEPAAAPIPPESPAVEQAASEQAPETPAAAAEPPAAMPSSDPPPQV